MQVPTIDTFQKGATVLTGRVSAPEFHDFASRQAQETGRALQGAGNVMAAVVREEQQEANMTVAKELDVQATQRFNAVLYDPDNGFLSQQGKNAIDGYDGAVKALGSIRDEVLGGARSPEVKKLAGSILATRMQHSMDAINRHSIQETTRFKAQTYDARAQVSLQTAALDPTNEALFQQMLGATRAETAALAKLHGWDEATARVQAANYQDTGHRVRYEAWAAKDPLTAFTHFQQNGTGISPLVRDIVGRQLFQQAAPEIAWQINQAGATLPAPNAPTDPTEPRGVRNNNPGNLIRGSKSWDGEVDGGDPRYASFSSPEAGIRAMGKTLLNYQDRYGLRTIEGIIGRWAPSSENDTAGYVRNVAKALGTTPDAPLDLHDAKTLGTLTRAIIVQENGKQPYTDQQIAVGLAAATGNNPVKPAAAGPSRDPNAPTGLALVDSLPPGWKLHVLQMARSQAHQQMSEARETLRGKVEDASAEYMAMGVAKEPPTFNDFFRAYGQDEGARRYRDFQSVAALGQTLQQVRTLPAEALADLVKTSKPAPGDGFAVRQHNYEVLTHAVDTVTRARKEDPIAYSITNKDFGLSAITSFSKVEDFAPEIARRAANAGQVAASYGTSLALLTKGESKALGATLKVSPVEGQKALLATLSKHSGGLDNFKQLMQSVAPDSPTLAVAGIYQARGLRTTADRDVADLILRGQSILTPMNAKEDGKGHMGGQSLIKMPEEKLMLSDWIDATGDAFKGKEQAADLFMQTAKAIYAARSAEEGDYSGAINSKRWKGAIMLATGGIESHNGSKVVMPYGVKYDEFQNTLKAQADQLAPKALNTTSREMMRLPLENIGDGRYLFRRGAGYLVDKQGRPIIADLNGGR